MRSTFKRQKRSKKRFEDRISDLPNSLIAQILSLLPTKYAVSTSILSKRWKQSWTSITNLDFYDKLLFHHTDDFTVESLQRSFTSFVNRVLLHHASCVQRFRLRCSEHCGASLVNGWIAHTLLRNVQELDLCLAETFVLPQDLFTCRTLVVLKLDSDECGILTVPASVSLPSLKILRLSHFDCEDDDSINRFLFGCPVLEELSMSDCLGENVSVVNIFAPRLTSLSMDDCMYPSPHNFKPKIVLDTPALLYLKIREYSADGRYLVENLHRLIRADILLDAGDASAKGLTDLLKGMSNVQFLRLSPPYTYMCDGQLPMFLNMTCLELGRRVRGEFLLELLENTPNLETLVFKEGLGYDYEEFTELIQNPARNMPSCFLFHLKVIELGRFGWQNKEWEIVGYFLRNLKVLEEVNIVSGYGRPKWTIYRT